MANAATVVVAADRGEDFKTGIPFNNNSTAAFPIVIYTRMLIWSIQNSRCYKTGFDKRRYIEWKNVSETYGNLYISSFLTSFVLYT